MNDLASDSQLWSWIDGESPALADYLARHPQESARVRAVRSLTAMISEADRAPGVPETIGPYRIIGILGEGAQGIVYRALQTSPAREVAVKVVRPAASVRQRALFDREVETLARLQHPAIAAIYEAGESDDGSRYIAMELVDGVEFTRYAREHRLSWQARLRLFTDICLAVHHAHQRGVIHRDLKPSNILVDAAGRPKILDFGLAQLAEPGDRAGATREGEVVGTLMYMSPEQARGQTPSVDVTSDVYTLGVLLHELLAGEPPYDLDRDQDLPGLVAAICERAPRRLGSVVRELRGDVEVIVHKALEKERARRYQSALTLAEDLDRVLGSRPIQARPPSGLYVVGKLVRRHRLAAALGALALTLALALSVVSSVSSLELRRERTEVMRQAAIAEAVNEFLNTDLIGHGDLGIPPARGMTLRSVIERASARIDGRFPDEPLVEAAIHEAIGMAFARLGAAEPARRHLERSVSMRRVHLGVFDARTISAGLALGDVYASLGRAPEAIDLYEALRAGAAEAFGPEHELTLIGRARLAGLHADAGRTDQARTMARQILDTSLARREPDASPVIDARQAMAQVLLAEGDEAGASRHLELVLQSRQASLGPRHARTLVAQGLLAVALRRVSPARAQMLFDDLVEFLTKLGARARSATRPGLEDLAGLVGRRGSSVIPFFVGLGMAFDPAARGGAETLAFADVEARRFDEARPILESLRQWYNTHESQSDAATWVLFNLARIAHGQGDLARAENMYRYCLERLERHHGPQDADTLRVMIQIAVVRADQGDLDQAQALLARVRTAPPESLEFLGSLMTQAAIRIGDRKGAVE